MTDDPRRPRRGDRQPWSFRRHGDQPVNLQPPHQGSATDEDGAVVRRMEVIGVRVEIETNNPIVLLKETDGDRYLPIWIGPSEATAIAFAQQGIVPKSPLTHDLMRDVLDALGIRLAAVSITELRDGIFTSNLSFAGGQRVRARPSDAIALAIRTDAPIQVSEEILKEAGVALPDGSENPGQEAKK